MRVKAHHAWLFTFTDLAFLLLISLSLIPSAPEDVIFHFSEMDVPVVPGNPNLSPIQKSEEVWELRVYGENIGTHPSPFKLVRFAGLKSTSTPLHSDYLHQNELLSELQLLKERGIRPVLLPSKTSLTRDFLFAAGAIARIWDNTKSNTIVKHVNTKEGY